MEEKEVVIDGVKLIGWAAIVVNRLEKVEADVKKFLSHLAGVEREMAGLKEKLIKIVNMVK